MDNKIYLITRGDDCGSSHSANRAILEACGKGLLKNISLMVVCPEIREAVEMFAGRKDICFGLHVTMNAEWDGKTWGPVLPAYKVPSITDGRGAFFQSTQALHQNRPSLDEMMAEIQAQLDRARELNFDIAYAEMHMCFSWVEEHLAEEFDRWCRKEGIINGHRYDGQLPEISEERDPVTKLIARLKAAVPGVYTHIAHPAYDDDEMRNLRNKDYHGSVVAMEREWDRRILTDAGVIKYILGSNVVPVRYDEVPV